MYIAFPRNTFSIQYVFVLFWFFFCYLHVFCIVGYGYAASGGLYKFFYDFSSFSTFNKNIVNKNIVNMDALLMAKGWNVFKTTHKDILKMHDLMGKIHLRIPNNTRKTENYIHWNVALKTMEMNITVCDILNILFKRFRKSAIKKKRIKQWLKDKNKNEYKNQMYME